MSRCAKFKAIQWATGAMGRSCLRAIIDRDDTELVGLYCHGERKIGRDAGDLVHRPVTGITATHNRDEILALDADVVIHSSRIQKDPLVHDDDITALLRSGKNVISINGNTFPQIWPEQRRIAYETACAAGESSFLGAGLNPGFVAEKLLATLSGICTRVSHVNLHETVIAGMIKSPEYIFDVLGFGSDLDKINLQDGSFAASTTLNNMFEEVVSGIAAQHGWNLTEIRRLHRVLPAGRDVEIAAGVVKAGQVSQIDWQWRGMAGDEERIALTVSWAIDEEHAGTNPDLWTVKIQGEPNVDVSLNIERPEDMPGSTSGEQMAVSGAVANAIPYAIEAAPGLLNASFATPWYADPLQPDYLTSLSRTFAWPAGQ